MAHVHAKPDWRYWLDFYLYPAIVAGCFVFGGVNLHWLWAVPLGFLFWTFAEYWAHRSILHTIFWQNHGTHLHHHQHPEDFVIFPIWQLPLVWLAFFLIMPLPFFAGFTLGYVWFVALHHMLHHWQLNDGWLKQYSVWHDRHHKETYYNYGITTPIWDFVFRTYK